VHVERTRTPTVRVALYPKAWTDDSAQKPGVSAYCNPGNRNLCYRMTPDGNYLAEAFSASGSLTQAQLKQILDGLVFAPVENRSAWFPVTEAVPA
jgi:hypothetical protein